jgi:CBS domain-containing protein
MRLINVLEDKGKEVHTISSNAMCNEVVTELVRLNIGSLLIRDAPNGPILGIITERDILRVQAKSQTSLDQLPVTKFMSRELITAEAEDDLTVAMRLMTTHRIRHLPVTRDNQLLGLLSIGDIVKTQHDELERENHQMRSYIQSGGGSVATPLP